ncbi:stress response protein NST1-like [Lycium ferocissimum]|uniref:stress response protein NST1-like n=1 Tax=Lycium ferocissimum TaxID=112874 RepID=UPI0028152AB9|nr:stress response protein NST1-like [Lycium ferocissimum]
MARNPLECFDILFDVQRLRRKSAHCGNKEAGSDNSDIWRFKRQIRKTKNIDEDYAQFLMLLLDYDKESINESANESIPIVRDELNDDMDEDGNEDEDDGDGNEDEDDEDEDDPDYKKFLANVKPKGNSYVLKVDRSDGFPVFVEYEKEDRSGSDEECECLGQEKQQDAGDEKDLDKVESHPFSRTVLENDNDVIVEPLGPVIQKEKGLTSQNPGRPRKGETKNRSDKEQKTGKGRKSAKKFNNKEEAADVDEDYSLLLEKFICKNWRMTNSFIRQYNLKRKPSLRALLESDSDIPPKKKKKKRLRKQKSSTKGNDASKRQGKGEKRKRSSKEPTARKGRKSSAVVAVNEDVARMTPVDVAVKEEIADVDEASFKAAEEDLQIIVGDNYTFGKEGSSNLIEASSEKHCENVEDSCPLQTVTSDFWWNVKALLEKPYDQKEYIELWKLVKCRKPVLKSSDLRNGKFCSTRRLGKSYLDHHKDLDEQLKEVDNDKMKKLNILRGFFFWLQNLTQKGAFRPWTNPEWLSLLENSTVPMLTFSDNQAGTMW